MASTYDICTNDDGAGIALGNVLLDNAKSNGVEGPEMFLEEPAMRSALGWPVAGGIWGFSEKVQLSGAGDGSFQ